MRPSATSVCATSCAFSSRYYYYYYYYNYYNYCCYYYCYYYTTTLLHYYYYYYYDYDYTHTHTHRILLRWHMRGRFRAERRVSSVARRLHVVPFACMRELVLLRQRLCV